MSIFIIGLPTALRARLVARAQHNQVRPGFALVAPDRFGKLNFVPYSAQARADLDAYCDTVDWSSLQIIQLPYVPIETELLDTVELLQKEGATIVSPTPGMGGWPAIDPNGRYGGAFNNEIYTALLEHLGWQAQALPSERFERSRDRYPDYLIVHGALDVCNTVDKSRFRFLYEAGDALEEFCRKRGGINQSLFAFFEERGLDLATTGGIRTTLRLMQNNRQVGAPLHEKIHLKEGDHTTPQAAARIYFQYLDRNGQFRLILFYVGPHPDSDIDRAIPWEAA